MKGAFEDVSAAERNALLAIDVGNAFALIGVVLVAGAIVAAIFFLAGYAEHIRSRRVWEKEIASREDYVRRGCPDVEIDEYGRELIDCVMAHWPDLIGPKSLNHYPDLKARDIAAYKEARRIERERHERGEDWYSKAKGARG